MINLSIPQSTEQLYPRITVVGVGGAGGNAVNNMIKSSLEGVEFVVANTDAQAITQNLAEKKLQLGVGITQGLGAGSRPDIGRGAAEEAIEEIVSHLEGSHMAFITAGMGGGTGTGAAPVIARAARDQGILTVGVVTKPFHFEGAHRMRIAEEGLNELQQYVDTLIIIPNQNLFRIANEKTTFADAFKMADEVLHSGVRGVTDLMVMPGLINLDFADIRTVMSEMGKAMMGTGEADGERRSVQAAEAAISNPLLDDVSMKGARGVLVNITGGMDMTLYEVDEATNRIRDEVDPEANIIFGSTFDEKLEGSIRVSVVATGIDAQLVQQPARPAVSNLSLVSDRSHQQGENQQEHRQPITGRGPGSQGHGGLRHGGHPSIGGGYRGNHTVPGSVPGQVAVGPAPGMSHGGSAATAMKLDYDQGYNQHGDHAAQGYQDAHQEGQVRRGEQVGDQFIPPEPVQSPPRQAAPPQTQHGAAHQAPQGYHQDHGDYQDSEQHGYDQYGYDPETYGQPEGHTVQAPQPEYDMPAERSAGPRPRATNPNPAPRTSRAGNIFRRMTGLLRDDDGGDRDPPPANPRTSQAGGTSAPRPQPRMGNGAPGPRAPRAPAPAPQAGHQTAPQSPSQSASGTRDDEQSTPPQPKQAPRTSGLESSGRGPLPSAEDEQLDIPAFLRRQAN